MPATTSHGAGDDTSRGRDDRSRAAGDRSGSGEDRPPGGADSERIGRRRSRPGPTNPTNVSDDDPEFDPHAPAEPPRPLPVAPVRRLVSLAMAGLAALLTAAMVVGAQFAHPSYALAVFGVQVMFVVVATVASQPPAPRLVAGVGIGVAAAADLAALRANPPSLAPLAYLTAVGFVAGVVAQLLRRAGRVRVTESLGSSIVLVLGVVSYATLVVLSRHPLGTQVISACAISAGSALVVAHLVDLVAPLPRVAPPVPRGGTGVVLGAMVGTATAGLAGFYLEGLETLPTAVAGLVAAVIALMADMSVDYAEAGRRLAGVAPAWWLVRHLQGPLTAFALAAPTAYAASLVLARGL